MRAPLAFDAPEVTDAIAAWMPSTRWFPLKGQQVDVTLAHAYDLGDAAILLLRAGDTLLQVPVAWRDEPGDSPIRQLGEHWLVDACGDADAVQAILDVAGGRRAAEGLAGDATAEPATAAAIRVITGEQSNTSIIGGADGEHLSWIAKVFRVVSPGDNPDVVVTGALTRAGCDRVPHLLASLAATWPAGDAFVTGHLLAVSQFVAGADDAWELHRQHALAALRGEERPAPDARALGAAVATVHRDLAAALGTAEATEADALRFISGLEQRLAWAREQAGDVLAELDDELGHAQEQLREIDSIGELQHIHGDLHLGQVLRAADGGWLLLDFEGEPLRPMHERAVREPRLRDVVGMLRSFDYAAGSALQESPDADPAVAGDWVVQRQQEFLAGYADTYGPVDPQDPVFRALLLDKALYEVVYELRNRPDWLPVPLEAVRALLTSNSSE
ncbi:aminoglycoside phosphotransferase [Agrococcus sp. HG114]|uniref:maltokinase N-terminal cap-like domain-containing protein n=1 Tax=Agrococcus sp. HG114 TaxID=2969757 RepID=UPI00215AB28E|nr:aminoglycoside phosphotransferase [Agrococcus sp. HG114]MCR8669858.1 aminoglycoside phosphotransferase [Agrococcus sp. HG114]